LVNAGLEAVLKLRRGWQRIILSLLVIIVSVLVSISPVFADASWTAGRPTTSFVYGTGSGGAVKLSNTYVGGTASNDAQLSLGVEVYSFQRNWDGFDNDRYVLRIMGGASSRLPHSYTVTDYAGYYVGDPDHCSSINPCTDSGLTAMNQGEWVYFTFPFFFWGQAYTKIFVCSNGWAAFVYDGPLDNCPTNPNIPAQDSVDSSRVFHDVPESIIAPLAKPLDPSANPVGKIRFLKPPPGVCNPNSCQSNYLGVIWDNVYTQGTANSCPQGWCTNSFSFLVFQSKTENTIEFGYHGLDFSDPWNKRETIGLDDPTGILSLSPDRSMAVCGVATCPSTGGLTSNHGVRMDEPNFGSAYLTDAKISVQKTSSSDTASAWFHPAANHLYGYNIQTTVPPQNPDPSVSIAADIVESLVVAGLCYIAPPSALVCFAIGTGVALANAVCHCTETLIKSLTPQQTAPPTFQWRDMVSTTMDGFVETPVQEQDHYCSPANQTPTGYPGGPTCAVDTSTFDIVEWDVPHNDPVSPTLKITYSAQTGGTLSTPGTTWRDTSVTLNLGPEGDFGISSGCNSIALQVGGYQTNCGVTLAGGNGFYGNVTLSPSARVGGGPSSQIIPSGVSFGLSSNSQLSANLAIQSGTDVGAFTIYVTASSGIRVHTLSIIVNVFGLDGSAVAGCSHFTNSCQASLSTSRGNDIIIVFAFELLDLKANCTFSITDTAGLAWAARSNVVFGRYNRDQMQEFWAKSPGVLTSDVITESILGCASAEYGGEYNGLHAFAISGAVFDNPFDANSSLPSTNSGLGTVASTTISTNNPGDMIISAVQHGGPPAATPQSGFTILISGGTTGGTATDYGFTSSALSGFSVSFSFSNSDYWQQIADALHGTVGGITMSVSPSSVGWACNPYGCDNPSPLSIVLGVASVNGFAGAVPLSYIPPSNSGGSSVTGPSFINVPAGGSAQVTLYAYMASVSGDYVWTIQAGSLASTTVTLSYRFCRCF